MLDSGLNIFIVKYKLSECLTFKETLILRTKDYSMNLKLILFSTMIYVLTIFPITALWHVGLFQELYLNFGYFNKEETLFNGIMGLVNIFVQGFILAILYSKTEFSGTHIMSGLKFSGIIFVFYFTLQVVNFVVRKEIHDVAFFIIMELVYMIVQFGVYGLLIGVLYGKNDAKA